MSRGKYARKHRRELENRVADRTQHHKLLDKIFEDSSHFLDKFKILNIDTQIKIVRLLYDIVKKEEGSPSFGKERFYAREAQNLLESVQAFAGCSYDTSNFYPLAKDEKRLIRMECSGTINRRKDDELSFLFRHFSKQAEPGKYSQSSYKLLASPSWKVFHQFESYRSIEPDIRKYLQKTGINPDALKVMTINDFCEIIFQTYKKDNSELVVNFLPKTESIKSKQVKAIMKYAGKEYEALLLKRRNADGTKLDPRVVKSFCNMTKRFGCDDVDSLIVTEDKYTERAINDLKNAGFDVSTMKVGEPIPQEFIDYLIDTNQATLILAYDENGNQLDKSGLPRTQFHHNHAVMLAGKGDTIAAVNYPNNGIDVEPRIHQEFIHLFDRILHSGDIEQISARLNIQNKDMRVLLGFNAEKDALYCDLENNPEFQRRKLKDLKCKVNYFDMMQERMQNEAVVIAKYQIDCPRSYIKEGYRNLREIKSTPNYNKEAMRQIEKLLKNQHTSKKKGKSR